jgi:hypothetical protein
MSRKHNKNRLAPFVPLLISTLESAAWRAMSHGARSLYVAIKRRVPGGRNRAYLSYGDAAKEIGCGKTQVSVWYEELEHYGFIVMVQPGCLGFDGKGKAPHWRLTELGQTSRSTADELPEVPSRDFQNWDGTKFKTLSRRAGHCVPLWETPLSRRAGHPKPKVSRRGGHREAGRCPVVEDTTI